MPPPKVKDQAYYDKRRVVDCRKKKKCPSKLKPQPCLPKKSFMNSIGPKQINIGLSYVPPLVRYGAASLITIFYLSDFKALLQYLPFYNGKYVTEEDVKKPAVVLAEEDVKKQAVALAEENKDSTKKDC